MPPSTLAYATARRVDATLVARGLPNRVRELPSSTRTASEAALAVGCRERQIVKSLVFRGRSSGSAILCLVAGDHRLDEQWMRQYVGEPLDRADPEFVRSRTGFAIGGVPPLGHPTGLPTFVDYDLLELPEVWAAAGHPHAVCRLSPFELLVMTDGKPVSVVPLTVRDEGAWVTFDCYGTLVDWRAGFALAARQSLRPLTAADADRLFDAYLRREREIETAPYRPSRALLAEGTIAAGRQLGLSVSAADADAIAASVPEWPTFPDARPALDAVHRAGRRVAILSNIDRDLLDATISRNGLSVDLTIVAEEVRSYKPALGHWVRFLKTTAARPEETLHVSGAYEYDLPPAARLGFRTAYVARHGEEAPGPDVHAVVRSRTELPAVLPRRHGGKEGDAE
ncbi:MAG: YbaK/EbsC family protein [Thermoplasmata archaeon]